MLEVEEFDRWHAAQPERWELVAGIPVKVSIRSLPHTLIKGNVYLALRNKLEGTGCQAYVSGVEVKERSCRLSAMPDVAVECRPPDFLSPVIAHPVLVAEVMALTRESDQADAKWRGYRLIPSLEHYLVVDEENASVLAYTRTSPSAFAEHTVREGLVKLTALGVSLSLDEIYDGVALFGTDMDA